jgi:cation diffusion facilitator CzcD-associated flavoprotein CzcO
LPYIRFNTTISRAEFNEAYGHWQLTTQQGDTLTARVIIGAIGPLNRPSIPELAGADSFTGTVFHSARWNHSCDLTGKRVAVIGTGASAIQLVPEVAKIASQLYVFQRTAPYVMPRLDGEVSTGTKALFRRFPGMQKLAREAIYWLNEVQGLSFRGHKLVNKLGTWRALRHLKKQINDPVLRQKLTPDYLLGCKRVLISNDYYPALTQPNVELVTESISGIGPNAIQTKDGNAYTVDVIIYSTGFQLAGGLFDLNIIGLNGRQLINDWLTQGIGSNKGITISGYPNLLLLVGPNTGLGHNSIIHMIESQLTYALDYLRLLDELGAGAALDVRPNVQQAYGTVLQMRFSPTVWASGCRSWYVDSRGQNTALWPGSTMEYRRSTRHVNPLDYDVLTAKALLEVQ